VFCPGPWVDKEQEEWRIVMVKNIIAFWGLLLWFLFFFELKTEPEHGRRIFPSFVWDLNLGGWWLWVPLRYNDCSSK